MGLYIIYDFTTFKKKISYRTLWCIISLPTKYTKESDPVRQTHYTTKRTCLVDFNNIFPSIFKTFSSPAAETLFLLALSILAMESADSIRSLYRHFLSGITQKSLTAFYYACSYSKADYSRFMNVMASLALKLIPEELRIFFLKDHSLLNCLFHSVRDVILRMFFKLNKSKNFNSGFICVPHTFGRDLKWNPHIHALISQGGAGNFTAWRPHTHFDYRFLRLSVKSFWSSSPLNLDRLLRNLKTRFTKTIPMGFMSGPNPIRAPLISLLNISADIWAGPSLPLPGLMPMMGLL